MGVGLRITIDDELTGTMKKLFDLSSIPARAFHHAINAVINPKIPAAFVIGALVEPSAPCWKWATVRSRKVMSRKKNSEKKARVDLNVQIRQRVVKMNHPARKYPTALFRSALDSYADA